MSLLTAISSQSKRRLDPDAAAYIAAVVDAGGVVSGGQKSAINIFYKTGKSDGWYPSLKRVYLPIWAAAAPNAIDMIARGSGTFVGDVTHAAGYTSSDGSTGYFNIGESLATIGCALNSASFGGLATNTSAIGIMRFLGVQDSSNATRSILASSVSSNWLTRVSSSSAATSATLTELRGVILASRSNSTTVNVWQRTASGITRPINEASLASGTLNATASAVFLATNNDGVISAFASSAQRTGAMFIGTGFTNAEAESFTLALKNLWEGTTGLTLP